MNLCFLLNPSSLHNLNSSGVFTGRGNPFSDTKICNCSWLGCQKSFKRNSELIRHERIHTGERPYECPKCSKRFIQRSALTVHTRTHTGERPHHCSFSGCGHSFTDSSSLARHKKSHDGLRPFICQYLGCERAFTRSPALLKHQKKHYRDSNYSTERINGGIPREDSFELAIY
ncbi:hypothetical protein K7432_005071 [Basidiobolus ranarum]|uniref:C2H2-type domain-containing protein n=1 Tax=Basidiobolus ranarum TaxID=34480 RepID=A0ABR2W3V7_9FUNG